MNIGAFAGVALSILFAVVYATKAAPGMGLPLLINLANAVLLMTVPWLHRFGPLVGPNALLAISSTAIICLAFTFGSDGGVQYYFLVVPAVSILFLGSDRLALVSGWTGLGILAIVAVQIIVPPNTGLQSADELLYGGFIPTVAASSLVLFGTVLYAVRQMNRAEAIAEAEHVRSEALLLHIMPAGVAQRLKGGTVVADYHKDVSILFADMAGFTASASRLSPVQLVTFLDTVYTRFDSLVTAHGLEKIKTTGDSYMVVSGLPETREDHAESLARFALALRGEVRELTAPAGEPLAIRIGIATGPVVAGVVGRSKFFYDVWGDAVNMASRMESTGQPDRIQVSSATHERLRLTFELEARGPIPVRGKGTVETWFLVREKAEPT